MVLLALFSHLFCRKTTCKALWVRCQGNASLPYVDEGVLLYRPTIFTKVIGNCYIEYRFCPRNMATGDLMSWTCVRKEQFYLLLWIILSIHQCVIFLQEATLHGSVKYNAPQFPGYLSSLILPHNLLKSALRI